MRIVVLLAKDPAIRESLRAALPEQDLLVVEESIDDAIRRVVTSKPDLVLVDDSPRLTASDLDRLKPALRGVPMMILTSRCDSETRAAFMVGGARACIEKPFQCEALLSQIDELVDRPQTNPTAPPAAETPIRDLSYVYQHQSALKWMSRTMGQLEDPNLLARNIVDALVDVFDTARAAVVLLKNGSARVVASQGLAEGIAEPIRLVFAGGLMRWLDENGCLFDRRRHPDAYDAQKEMGVLRARLAFPIVVDGLTRGAVLLGEKASGLDYSGEERELLSIMTRNLAANLERSRQFRDATRQRKRVDAVLSSITTGVITVRNDKTVSMMNESAERLLGINAVSVLGKSVQGLGSRFADLVLRTLRTGEPCLREEIRLTHPNVTLGVSVTPVADEGVAAIFAAIPARESAHGEVDSRFWEYLSSRVAQEIKNPMVAINTFAQLLPTKYDSKGFRDEFATIVQSEVARINNVVAALYAFARPADLRVQDCDLNQEVKKAIAGLENEMTQHRIGVETSFETNGVSIAADSALLSEALKQVVQNSIDAMADGGTLKLQTKRNNGWCEVLVSDTGAGVSEQDAPHIFLPFYSTKEKGMGLGLTMAQRIMSQHDGRVDLVDTSARGSLFALRMPPAAS